VIVSTGRLGGTDATVCAPQAGDDLSALRLTMPAGGLYGLDVEGTWMGDQGQWSPGFSVRLVQFATAGQAWVMDVSDDAQRAAACELLSDESVTFASHTSMDVQAVRVALGVDVAGRNIDTHGLASMVHTQRRGGRDLKTLAAEHLGPGLGEAEDALHARFAGLYEADHGHRARKKADLEAYGWSAVPVDDPAYLRYAGLDAIACRRLVDVLTPMTGAPLALLGSETWLAEQCVRIRRRGMRVDTGMLEEVRAEADAALAAEDGPIRALTGGVGPRSPALVVWLGEHGADFSRWESLGGARTGTGAPSLAGSAVGLLPLLDLDEAASEVAERLGRFKAHQDRAVRCAGISRALCGDGRVRPTIHPLGAPATARMSSTGPNVQNISTDDPRLRGMFVPDDGYVLMSCDLDQVELRMAAGLAGEVSMIEAIRRGDDLHSLTAAKIGRDRGLGKMTNFLIVYGGGGRALAAQAGIGLEDAQEAVRAFKIAYPAITALSRRLALRTDYVRTASGRMLEVGRTPSGDPRGYANINYLVQSSARDLLVRAWRRYADATGRPETVWLPIHDELVLHVPEEDADELGRAVEAAMTCTFRGVPITASCRVLRDETGASRWGK
jgi:DNA polymerase I